MRTEDVGILVGPADARASPTPSAGRWWPRSATSTPRAHTPSTTTPSRPAPRAHLHRDHEEAFYVLEGELTVRVGHARSWPPPAHSWWCHAAWYTDPPTRGRVRRGCCSCSRLRGRGASSRRQPKSACPSRDRRPRTRPSCRGSRPTPRSTATSSRSCRRYRKGPTRGPSFENEPSMPSGES